MAKVTFDINEVASWVGKNQRKLKTIMRRSVARAAIKIVEMTPVDTGFARAGWYPMINGEQSGKVVGYFSWRGAKFGDTLGLASNVAYINRLEYGHSKQAPSGMVRVTAAQWDVIVKEVAMEVRNG